MNRILSCFFLVVGAQWVVAGEPSLDPISLAQAVSPAIVSVQSRGMDSGSGFIVSADGYVVTCASLLTSVTSSVVVKTAAGQTFTADVVATDRGTESALLRLKLPIGSTLPYLVLADSSMVKTGSRALTAGNPLDALSFDHQVAVSFGTITGSGEVRSADAASHYCGCALETDAAINAGSEGGALLDAAGHVIGMTCLCVDRVRMRGCAVPSNRIREAYGAILAGHMVDDNASLKICPINGAETSALRLNSETDPASAPTNPTVTFPPGTELKVVTTRASSASPVVCHCIVSAARRCDGGAVQIDARLNESDSGARVFNRRDELVGTISHTDLAARFAAQNAGVSFFTPIDKPPATATPGDPIIALVAASTRAFVFIGDGSGVVISDDGLILTNEHVAGGASTWAVRLGGERQTRMADVVGRDKQKDVCLLKLRGVVHAPHLNLGDSGALVTGERVLALGDPFKLGERDGDPAASVGIISALHRNQGRYSDAIQTDCAINPGNSGGPLINMKGELVGINGQIVSRFGKNNTGIAFAIPANQIKRLLPALNGGQGGNALADVQPRESQP